MKAMMLAAAAAVNSGSAAARGHSNRSWRRGARGGRSLLATAPASASGHRQQTSVTHGQAGGLVTYK